MTTGAVTSAMAAHTLEQQDQAAKAAALAAEALRLAEEAKRAQARVAEVRKSLSFVRSPLCSPAAGGGLGTPTPRSGRTTSKFFNEEYTAAPKTFSEELYTASPRAVVRVASPEERDVNSLLGRMSMDPPEKTDSADPPQSAGKEGAAAEPRHTNPPTPPRSVQVQSDTIPSETGAVANFKTLTAVPSTGPKEPPSPERPSPQATQAPKPEPEQAIVPPPPPPPPVQQKAESPAQATEAVHSPDDEQTAADAEQPKELKQIVSPPPPPSQFTAIKKDESSSNLLVQLLDAVGFDTLCGVDEKTLSKERQEEAAKLARKEALEAEQKRKELEAYGETYGLSKAVTNELIEKHVPSPPSSPKGVREQQQDPPDADAKTQEDPVVAAAAATAAAATVPVLRTLAPTTVVAEEEPRTVAPAAPVAQEPVQQEQIAATPEPTPVAAPAEPEIAAAFSVDDTMEEARKLANAMSGESAASMNSRAYRSAASRRLHKNELVHPVMAYPDPFGNEHEEDMNFMPCGCSDPAVNVNDYEQSFPPPPQQAQYVVRQNSSALNEPNCC